MPFFRDAFGLSRFTVGFVVTALTIGYAVWLLPLGALVDRFGERRLLVVGLIGLSAGAATVAGAPTYALLLAAAFFLGPMYATAIPGTNKAVYDNIAAGRQNPPTAFDSSRRSTSQQCGSDSDCGLLSNNR